MRPRWRPWAGWLTVHIHTREPADLVTRLTSQDVALVHIASTDQGIRCRVPVSDLRRVHRATQGRNEWIRVEARHGPDRLRRRLWHRPALLAGALTAVLLLAYVTPRIWLVEVAGVSPSTAAQVVAAAADGGLWTGVPRAQVSPRAVERAILQAVAGYAWAGLTVEGSIAVVRLHAFTAPPPITFPHELVASRAAEVVSLSVYVGEALVQAGSHVKPGQVLIRGYGPLTGPVDEAGPHGPSQAAAAAGTVLGRVEERWSTFQPYRTVRTHLTGIHYARTWYVLNGSSFLLAGWEPVPFASSQEDVTRTPVLWRDVRLPGQIVRVVYNETISVHERLDRERAEAWVRDRLHRRLQEWSRDGLVSHTAYTMAARRDGVAGTVTAVVVQNIAVPRQPPIKGGT